MNWQKLAPVTLTYKETGATDGELPAGYRHVRREAPIGAGRNVFEEAGAKLMGWEMQRRAGVMKDTSARKAEPGAMVRVGVGPISGVCRVIYVVDEPNRRGFAYGTLPGHPESGEEFFGVRFDPADGTVYAQIVAFSRPGRWWSRAGSWIASGVQRRITDKYLDALAAGA